VVTLEFLKQNIMKTFRQELVLCTPQQLEEVYRLWGMRGLTDTRSSSRQDILFQRIKDPIAARFVWEYLSENERDILYQLLHHSARGGTRRDVIQQKAQISPAQLAVAIANLEHYLLIQEQTTTVRVQPTAVRSTKNKVVSISEQVILLAAYPENADALYTAGKEFFSPKSDRSQMTLDKIMNQFYYGNLDLVATHYNLPNVGYYSTTQLRQMIETELLDPQAAFEVLQQLDPPLHDLFKWLCEQRGSVSMQAVRQHTGYDDTKLLNALHTFDEYAIAFDTFSGQQRVLFIPSNIYNNLRQAALHPIQAEVPLAFVPLASPPEVIHAGHTSAIYDLAIILGAVYQQNIEPTQAGTVPKRIANKMILPLLHGKPRYRFMGDNNEYLEMIFQIAKELGLIQLSKNTMDGMKQRYEPGAQLEQWAQLHLEEQARKLVQCWTKSFHWLDINGANFHQWDPYYWNPIVARASLVEHLKDCIAGQWYSVASLLQKIWDKDPFELRPPHYSQRTANRRTTPAMRAKWNSCEGEVYTGMLASTLYEFGLVTLGYQQASQPEAGKPVNPEFFMLTDVGAAVLSTKEKLPSTMTSGSQGLIVQPNFELLLLQPDIPTLYSILPFAQVNQVEMVSRLTMTKASLLRGVEAGYDIEEILEILAERSQKEIPQNVAYTLRDWVKLYKDVKISQVLLLEVSSEAAADELSSSSKFKEFNLRKIAPRMLLVSNDVNVQTLRNNLNKEGVIVRINGEIFTRQNRYAYSGY